MSVTERMRLVRMIEKMQLQEEYSKRLGLSNVSRYKEVDTAGGHRDIKGN